MADEVLFVVHGMGENPEGEFSARVSNLLNDAMSNYGIYGNERITNYVDIVELNYDHLFETQRQRWKNESEAVGKLLMKLPDTIMQSWLSDHEFQMLMDVSNVGEDTFFNTHILDVLLYRFTNIGERIRVHLAKKIVQTLVSKRAPSYSILAFSLGTSVIHDTLHALFHLRGWKKKITQRKDFTLHKYKASNLISICNVSRILQSGSVRAYKSKVKPGEGGVCKYMLNVTHNFDPIARTKEFAPGTEWLRKRRDLFQNLQIEDAVDRNIHSLEHYLGNPDVNREVLTRLTSANEEFPGSETEFAAVLADYESRSIKGTSREFFRKLRELKVSDPTSRQEVIKSWSEFYKLLNDITESA